MKNNILIYFFFILINIGYSQGIKTSFIDISYNGRKEKIEYRILPLIEKGEPTEILVMGIDRNADVGKIKLICQQISYKTKLTKFEIFSNEIDLIEMNKKRKDRNIDKIWKWTIGLYENKEFIFYEFY